MLVRLFVFFFVQERTAGLISHVLFMMRLYLTDDFEFCFVLKATLSKNGTVLSCVNYIILSVKFCPCMVRLHSVVIKPKRPSGLPQRPSRSLQRPSGSPHRPSGSSLRPSGSPQAHQKKKNVAHSNKWGWGWCGVGGEGG